MMRRSTRAALLCLGVLCCVGFYAIQAPQAQVLTALEALPDLSFTVESPLDKAILESPLNKATVESPFNKAVEEPPLDKIAVTPPLDKAVVVPRLSSENTDWVLAELSEWHPAIYTVDDPTAPLHTSVNKGREALAYLRYIIDNYHALPATIAFIHSHKDGWPEAWHNDNTDYSNVETLRTLRIAYVQAQGFVNLRCNPDPGCPAEIVFDRQPPDAEHITEKYMPDAWRILFPNVTAPAVLATACCAQIAVSREQVLKRPLSDYQRYRKWILDTELSDEFAGRVMEYLWHVIFGRDPVFCPDLEMCYCNVYGRC